MSAKHTTYSVSYTVDGVNWAAARQNIPAWQEAYALYEELIRDTVNNRVAIESFTRETILSYARKEA